MRIFLVNCFCRRLTSSIQHSRGVALLQALIFVGLIMLTSAAVLILTLGGFIAGAKGKESQANKYRAESVLPVIYECIKTQDPETDGEMKDGDNACNKTYNMLTAEGETRPVIVNVTWNDTAAPPRYDITIEVQ